MPWGKCDDTFHKNPKVQDLDPRLRAACCGVYWQAISWCNDNLTDGAVPRALVRLWGGRKAVADELVRVGLWEEDGAGYRVHDFLDFNKSREQVVAERSARSEAGKHGADARWHGAMPVAMANAMAESQAAGLGTYPVPITTNSKWGSTWTEYLSAWHERGFRKPPSDRQREMLWEVVDARPTDSAKWLRSAPAGCTPFEAVQHVLRQWQRFRREAA